MADDQAEVGHEGADSMTVEQRVEALTALARDEDPRVRKSVAIALGSLACSQTTTALCDLLDDADEGVRVLACQALGRAADPAAVGALLGRVHDESAEVRAGVLFALANVVAHGGISAEARAALFTPMVVMAFDPDDGVRADAAATLGTLRDERAGEPLALLAQDACARVRANACASLGLADAPEGLDVLLERAGDAGEEPLVRVAALDGLARRAERGMLVAGTPQARQAAEIACTLAEEGGEQAAGLRASAADGAAGSGASAGAGASESADTPADAPTQADLRATAVWALGLLPLGEGRARAQEVLEAALVCDDAWCQRYAIEALARLGDAPAHAALRDLDAARTSGARALAPEVASVLDQALSLGDR